VGFWKMLEDQVAGERETGGCVLAEGVVCVDPGMLVGEQYGV
jgi:hypothetical protein